MIPKNNQNSKLILWLSLFTTKIITKFKIKNVHKGIVYTIGHSITLLTNLLKCWKEADSIEMFGGYQAFPGSRKFPPV